MAINFETFKSGGLSYVLSKLKTFLDLKFDKTGGEITGNVKIDGSLTLDIEDEDYDAGIRFTKTLDTNAGTILTMTGYANANNDNTNYKPVIRNVADPINNYDVANKHYVDAQIQHATLYLTFLNSDGTIDTVTSSLTYSAVKSALTNPTAGAYLDIVLGTSRFYVKAVQDMDTNNGPIKFVGPYIGSDNTLRMAVFTLASDDTLTPGHIFVENWNFKVQDVVANAQNNLTYPSTAAVYNQFRRKPVTVWEVENASQGLLALNTNITANLAWQLTNLDLTPYSRIKIFAKAGRKTGATAADSSITPAVILEMSLDDRAKETVSQNVFIGSILFQNPNDANRLGALTCAVSADKTKFAVTRATSLYGTAATSNTDTYQYVFKIEGFYD